MLELSSQNIKSVAAIIRKNIKHGVPSISTNWVIITVKAPEGMTFDQLITLAVNTPRKKKK